MFVLRLLADRRAMWSTAALNFPGVARTSKFAEITGSAFEIGKSGIFLGEIWFNDFKLICAVQPILRKTFRFRRRANQ